MSRLDDAFHLGTFESGSFGARFKICFDRDPDAPSVCFDVGAHQDREIYVAHNVAGQAAETDDMQRIETHETWAGTMKQLRWLRSQSQPTIRHWFRENGFESFIDREIASAEARPS